MYLLNHTTHEPSKPHSKSGQGLTEETRRPTVWVWLELRQNFQHFSIF